MNRYLARSFYANVIATSILLAWCTGAVAGTLVTCGAVKNLSPAENGWLKKAFCAAVRKSQTGGSSICQPISFAANCGMRSMSEGEALPETTCKLSTDVGAVYDTGVWISPDNSYYYTTADGKEVYQRCTGGTWAGLWFGGGGGSVTPTASCTAKSTTIDFGSVSPSAFATASKSGTVTVTCTEEVSASARVSSVVGLGNGGVSELSVSPERASGSSLAFNVKSQISVPTGTRVAPGPFTGTHVLTVEYE